MTFIRQTIEITPGIWQLRNGRRVTIVEEDTIIFDDHIIVIGLPTAVKMWNEFGNSRVAPRYDLVYKERGYSECNSPETAALMSLERVQ